MEAVTRILARDCTKFNTYANVPNNAGDKGAL